MKKIVLALSLAVASLFSFNANATAGRTCGSMDHLSQQKINDPGLEQRMNDIENQTAAYVAQQQSKNANRMNSVVTIPVVFHIVYSSTAQNISDAQCIAQLNQLNLDYAKLNTDASLIPSTFSSVAANTNIQFCLAQRTPTGAATTGIERRLTTTTSFSTNDNVKRYANGGLDAWNSSNYLNLWVCNLSGGVLGYAQFPGGSATTDGVVLLYSSVGSMLSPTSGAPYNLGRTATHEVGHWLNLRHIWGDATCGDDLVGDTPLHNTANYGCPAAGHRSTCTGTPIEMTMNYMDYTDDACMYMFSAGQSTRMNALFATGGTRASMLTSQGCTPPSGCGSPTSVTSSNVTGTSATLGWAAVTGANSYTIQYCISGTTTCTSTTTTSTTVALSGLTGGTTYTYSIQASCTAGTSTATTGSFATLATSCGNPTVNAASGITSGGATLSWTAVSGAVNYSVQYRLSTATAWTTVTSSSTSTTLSGLTANASYAWQVAANCNGLSGTYVAGTNFTTLASTTCVDLNESNNTTATAKVIATNTNISGAISSGTDKDYFKFTTVSPNTKIKIDLTNLPADYDMKLYSSNGTTTLTTAANAGTASESIIRNVTTAATYYIQVYPFSTASTGYNANVCYNLRVNVGSVNYRLNQDGTMAEEMETPMNQMVLYPNPAQNEVNVILNADDNSTMNLSIYDMVGKLASSQQVNVNAGFNKFNVDVTSLNKGIYFVELSNNNDRQVKKLIIGQ